MFRTLFLILCLPLMAFGQNIDSLNTILASSASDTVKVNALYKLAGAYEDTIPSKSISYLEQALVLARKTPNSLQLPKIANQLGSMYFYSGDYEKAIRNFIVTMKAYEKLKKRSGIADCMNNIGSVYVEQHNYYKSLEYHLKALKIRQENVENGTGDKNDVAMSLGNIGQSYYYLNKHNEAMNYYNKCIAMSQETGNKRRIALMYNNIGSVFAQEKKYDDALTYFEKALVIQEEFGNKQRVAMALNNIGEVYLQKGDYKKSLENYTKGLAAAEEGDALDDIKTSYQGLHDTYLALKDFENAHTYLKLFTEIKDSMYDQENTAQINEMLTKFDTNKKEQEIVLLQKEQEIRMFWQKSLIVGCVFILLVAILLYNRNKVKQRANNELAQKNISIEEQKAEIELKNTQLAFKNKEVTDSIKYAKHLQLAILPPDNQVKQLLPDSFVLYKPKDIVSGDFYWVEEWGNKIFVAAADCTGHGVPGAFMSIVGNNLLQQALHLFGLDKPNLILNQVNKNISKMLHQSEKDSSVRDGMDIALIALDKKNLGIEYSGAYNPLWIIREKELIEISANKFPIGAFLGQELELFTLHQKELKKGDTIYVFTDGYADQFGGPKGKKFKYKSLQQLLLNSQHLSMEEQRVLLDSTLEKWRGNLEQVDDILIVGIKI